MDDQLLDTLRREVHNLQLSHAELDHTVKLMADEIQELKVLRETRIEVPADAVCDDDALAHARWRQEQFAATEPSPMVVDEPNPCPVKPTSGTRGPDCKCGGTTRGNGEAFICQFSGKPMDSCCEGCGL